MENSGLTPHHGQFEGHSKLFLVMSLCFSAMAILLLVLPPFLGKRTGFHGSTSLNIAAIVSISVVILSAAFSLLMVFRRLSARIAKGNEDAEFVDQVRLGVSVMAQTFSIGLLLLASRLLR
ncbi:MAG: hypothetical protein ABSE46_11475 [Terracidiphilus sp.]|jgi:hypothetical protein